jgi:hypothetical protein
MKPKDYLTEEERLTYRYLASKMKEVKNLQELHFLEKRLDSFLEVSVSRYRKENGVS